MASAAFQVGRPDLSIIVLLGFAFFLRTMELLALPCQVVIAIVSSKTSRGLQQFLSLHEPELVKVLHFLWDRARPSGLIYSSPPLVFRTVIQGRWKDQSTARIYVDDARATLVQLLLPAHVTVQQQRLASLWRVAEPGQLPLDSWLGELAELQSVSLWSSEPPMGVAAHGRAGKGGKGLDTLQERQPQPLTFATVSAVKAIAALPQVFAAVRQLRFAAMLIMLAHAWFQLKHAKWFESQHLTMKDTRCFPGISLWCCALTEMRKEHEVRSGLPPEATDETQIASWQNASPDKSAACSAREFGELQAHPGETVRSVSIGYDVTSRWGEVEVLLDRHLAFADAEARGGLPEGVGLRPRQEGSIQCWQDEDSATVREWFRPGSETAMLGSGYAWLVFANHRDRDESLHKMLCLEKDGRGIVWEDPETGQRQVLDFGVPRCEPTNVRWEHLGLGICCRRALFLGALLLWLTAAGFLAISIYVPYAEYVTSFLEEAGKFPQGFMMGLLGFLIGLTWWAMCMMIGTCVNVAGFQTIEDENLFIFITFTIFCVAASAFNVYLTWYYTQDLWQHHTSSWFQRVKGFLLDTGGPVTTLRDLRKEIDFGFRVFQVLVPGVLFTPCLLSPLNNFLIPYFRESALLLLFGQGKSGREAERFLEPLPIGLAWDYQGHVTLPCCCCLTLFIMSPSMWWTQAYLCVWAFFFYFFQRFMHLRVCKKMYCTSNKLDSMVLYFGWGLLLAELAACHAYWRVRLQEWQWISILKAVALSYAVYWSLLWALGVPWPLRFRGELDRLERTRERSDDRCQSCEDFCYNWLNVNPVYVLKSQYCADEFGLDPCVFYEPGKEYLQLAPGDGDLHTAQSQRWKKASAGLWLEFEGLGCIAPICFDEVCTDVSSPTKSDSRNRLLRASEHDLSFGEADATPFLHDAKDSPSASAALASVPGDQDPMDVSDFLEPSPRDVATPSTSSAAKRQVPPDVNDAPEPSARDAARDQPNKQREAPEKASKGLEQSPSDAAAPSEPTPVQHEAPENASKGLEQSPSDAAAPSEPTPVQREAPENASKGLEQSPSDAAAPSEPTPVQHEAPENASKGLEQSSLVAKSGVSNARGDGTAWVGGGECADMEGPSDAAAPSEPTPVQHEAGPARLYAEKSIAGVRSGKVDSQWLRSSFDTVPWEAPENASKGLEQSSLVAKSGVSNARGDGTAWVGGGKCADMEGHEL
ncbi:ttn-1 [Symbiodinium sp. CCMP2592]|nr:ttn-1 [Symbiodinium sp. CCMP2592]